MRASAFIFGLCGLGLASSAAAAPLLYAWANHEAVNDGGFLAVIDADPESPSYGTLLTTAPTGAKGGAAHHVEHELDGAPTLFANDWGTGQTFVFDLADRSRPKVAASFERAGAFIFPHSFARLPNRNVLATFQSMGTAYAPPGGLVELDNKGRLVRSATSATPAIPTAINWPYSLAIPPGSDRVVTTSTDMGRGKGWTSPPTSHVQIWSIDQLKLLSSVALPPAPAAAGTVNQFPAEPRVLKDGSVLVNTFTCGLYRIEGMTGAAPSARFVHAFPGGKNEHEVCAVPVVFGRYWIQTVGAINGLIVLDVSDPGRPREVSRFTLPAKWAMPHWIGADRTTGRIAVTGHRAGWLAMLKFDDSTGTLSIDRAFGDDGELSMDRAQWPHGAKGKAIVHGTVFTR